MKNILRILVPIVGLSLADCVNINNQKYTNFANFVIKEGQKDDYGAVHVKFPKDGKNYHISYYSQLYFFESGIKISAKDSIITEEYYDQFSNGLDEYTLRGPGEIVQHFNFPTRKHEEKYDSLTITLPKWHKEFKKIKQTERKTK